MASCKGCGKPVLFIKDVEGTTQILDPSAPVFHVDRDFTGRDTATRAANHYVSHFKTCPKADDFSGKKRDPLAAALKRHGIRT